MSFSGIDDEYDPEFPLILSVWNRKPNSYLLVREKREKEEEENQRVFLVKQQLAEVSLPAFCKVQNEKHQREERRRLEENIRKGTIFDSIPTSGIGRGTQMTLPAWMTEVRDVACSG